MVTTMTQLRHTIPSMIHLVPSASSLPSEDTASPLDHPNDSESRRQPPLKAVRTKIQEQEKSKRDAEERRRRVEEAFLSSGPFDYNLRARNKTTAASVKGMPNLDNGTDGRPDNPSTFHYPQYMHCLLGTSDRILSGRDRHIDVSTMIQETDGNKGYTQIITDVICTQCLCMNG